MPGEHPLAEVARRLRPFLRDKRALLVGESANNAELKTIVRLAGARVMAAVDVHAALLLFARYPIDVVLVDPWLRTPTGETFEQLARSKNVEAVVVDYPHRPLAQILQGWPRADEARPRNAPARRPLLPDSHPARRRSRRTGS
jgi:hypothetical protein